VTLTTHPLLVPWPRKSRATPLLPLLAVRPVKNLSACTRVHLYLYLFCSIDQYIKVKVKVTLEQATKAQKGSRCIALLFL